MINLEFAGAGSGGRKKKLTVPLKQIELTTEEIFYSQKIDQVIQAIKQNKNLPLQIDNKEITFGSEKFKFSAAYICIGENEKKNEDCIFVNPAKGYGIVCDGIGSFSYSDEASQKAVKLLSQEMEKVVFSAKPEVVARHIKNRIIEAIAPQITRGATTLAAYKIVFDKKSQPYLVTFCLGDSRVFINRPGNKELIDATTEQTALIEFLEDLKKFLTEGFEQYKNFFNYYSAMNVEPSLMSAVIKKLEHDYSLYFLLAKKNKEKDPRQSALKRVLEDVNDKIKLFYEKKRCDLFYTKKIKDKVEAGQELLNNEELTVAFFKCYQELNRFIRKDLSAPTPVKFLKHQDIDSQIHKLQVGDTIIICSDGVTDNLSSEKLRKLSFGDPAKAVVKIIKEVQKVSNAPYAEALACAKPDDKGLGLLRLES